MAYGTPEAGMLVYEEQAAEAAGCKVRRFLAGFVGTPREARHCERRRVPPGPGLPQARGKRLEYFEIRPLAVHSSPAHPAYSVEAIGRGADDGTDQAALKNSRDRILARGQDCGVCGDPSGPVRRIGGTIILQPNRTGDRQGIRAPGRREGQRKASRSRQ